jgi:DNA-binding CsgD family transcriptional regulator
VRGRPSAAHWEAAALRWEQIANPAAAAEAWLGAADASFAEARPAEGRRAARRALDLASPLGMRPLLDTASALVQAADGRRRGAAQLGSGVSLTRREVEVLQLIAGGCTNREIAATLVIGEKTAATHVSNLLAKLGAARRTEAAVAALRLGLVVGEPPADASTADRGR